jgi:hypothetical protein
MNFARQGGEYSGGVDEKSAFAGFFVKRLKNASLR